MISHWETTASCSQPDGCSAAAQAASTEIKGQTHKHQSGNKASLATKVPTAPRPTSPSSFLESQGPTNCFPPVPPKSAKPSWSLFAPDPVQWHHTHGDGCVMLGKHQLLTALALPPGVLKTQIPASLQRSTGIFLYQPCTGDGPTERRAKFHVIAFCTADDDPLGILQIIPTSNRSGRKRLIDDAGDIVENNQFAFFMPVTYLFSRSKSAMKSTNACTPAKIHRVVNGRSDASYATVSPRGLQALAWRRPPPNCWSAPRSSKT